jgi:hypothetical protein
VVDIDDLQGICIFMVYQMHYPNIISDYFLVSDFVSKSVQLCSRAIYLNVLKSGVDFLLDGIEKDQLEKG